MPWVPVTKKKRTGLYPDAGGRRVGAKKKKKKRSNLQVWILLAKEVLAGESVYCAETMILGHSAERRKR